MANARLMRSFGLPLLTALTVPSLIGVAHAQRALDRVAPTNSPAQIAPPDLPVNDPAAVISSDATSGTATGAAPLLVGAVAIEGLVALTPADFAPVIAPRIGSLLGPAELAALASAIAAQAQARGYPFASAWIEPQRIANGVLRVRIDEGRIDEIRVQGGDHPAVRRALQPLANGAPARLQDVERRLLIAGDIDGVRITASRFVREGNRGILLVSVTQDRVTARASLSNEGTKPLGPEQLRVDVDLNAIFASDDSLTLTYSSTLFEPRELQFTRLRYAKRVNASGTEVAVVASGSIARPGAYLDGYDLESRSWFAAVELLQPLLRRRDSSLWLQAELGARDLVQYQRSVRVRDDHVRAARVSLYGYGTVGGGQLRVSTTLSQGFGVLGATRAGDPLASRRDADGTFTALSNWAEWTKGLAGPLSLRLGVFSQVASQPLLITEEAGLGGTAFLRGYDWSERTGDRGAAGMAELRYLWKQPAGFIDRAQLYVFVDGGEVSNLQGGFGGGSLASAGGGLRADLRHQLGVNMEVGVPLTGPRYDTGDRTPKLNLRLVRSF